MAKPATETRLAAAAKYAVMVQNSTIDLSDKIRINSTDYSPKRIEPQYWLDGTEMYRIVYFGDD